MRRTDITSSAFRRDLRNARYEATLGDDVVSVYRLKKNGQPSTNPTPNLQGQTRMNREVAEQFASHMNSLNPNSTYVVR